jgi:hypothetical protein
MPEETTWLDDRRLAMIDPLFANIRAAWTHEVKVRWFDSDSDEAAALRGGLTDIHGAVVRSEADQDIREMSALIIVDLRSASVASAGSLTMGRGGRTQVVMTADAKARREALFKTLLHELFHVSQHWTAGGIEGFTPLYDAESARAALDQRLHPRPLPGPEPFPGYWSNRFENAAEAYATAALTRLRVALTGGTFDMILPRCARVR